MVPLVRWARVGTTKVVRARIQSSSKIVYRPVVTSRAREHDTHRERRPPSTGIVLSPHSGNSNFTQILSKNFVYGAISISLTLLSCRANSSFRFREKTYTITTEFIEIIL